MPDLFSLALRHIPSAMRPDAERVAARLEQGYKPIEVAGELGLSRQRVGEMQSRLQAGMVKALHEDGYRDSEAIRYLGVPTAMVHRHLEDAA